MAIIHHIDLYGRRNDKYDWLETHTLESAQMTTLTPLAPYYFFTPKDMAGDAEYQAGFSVGEMFPVNVTGIVTMGDDFIIARSHDEIQTRLVRLIEQKQSKIAFESQYDLGKNYANWIYESIENGKIAEFDESKITKIAYRPFDTRYTYFDDKFLWRTRGKVTKHMLAWGNVGLVFKLGHDEKASATIMVCKSIIDFRSWSRPGMQWGDYLAPLYLISDHTTLDGQTRTPNLDPTLWARIDAAVGGQTTPEEVLDYIYAVLHAPAYRAKYREFLKIDFPRVPYPSSRESFDALTVLGAELRGLHLLESPVVQELITTFPVAGDMLVETPRYEEGRVYINTTQYFGEVPELAWTHFIGGYQPAQKWLKDRKWQCLTWEDLEHYQQMIVALSQTARIMQTIESTLTF